MLVFPIRYFIYPSLRITESHIAADQKEGQRKIDGERTDDMRRSSLPHVYNARSPRTERNVRRRSFRARPVCCTFRGSFTSLLFRRVHDPCIRPAFVITKVGRECWNRSNQKRELCSEGGPRVDDADSRSSLWWFFFCDSSTSGNFRTWFHL